MESLNSTQSYGCLAAIEMTIENSKEIGDSGSGQSRLPLTSKPVSPPIKKKLVRRKVDGLRTARTPTEYVCVVCGIKYKKNTGLKRKYCDNCRKERKQVKTYVKVPVIKKKCECCGIEFTTNQKTRKYCEMHTHRNDPIIKTWGDIRQRSKGVISELKVAEDLIMKGYEIYRNINTHGSVDLIAYNISGRLFAVEVTTGQQRKSGMKNYDKHKRHLKRIDILAVCYRKYIDYVVVIDGEIKDEIDMEDLLYVENEHSRMDGITEERLKEIKAIWNGGD